ncbi:MAG: DUF4959 domain-containing protein [Bacteroidales bacterium]|jgi:hypothetical protein|nr:DUF4959 domain-containing protein [Bacteroidales bacterium]
MKDQIMKFFRCYAAMAVAGLLFAACAEEERITYYDPDAPAPVALDRDAVSVINLPGKARISYKVPDDKNLLYVQAEYETTPGTIHTTNASFYSDTLLVEGFGKAGNYPVKLFSVGKNEKRSEPIEISVAPLTPPVLDAFPTIELGPVFGGVKGTFVNLHESELKLSLLADTVGDGRYTLLRSFVTNSSNAKFSYMGLPSIQSDFACYIQDRWGNRSDTVFFDDLTPFFEEPIDNKEDWTWYKLLPSDNFNWTEMAANPNNYKPENLWDRQNPAAYTGIYHHYPVQLPFTITISLGERPVVLSRFVFYQWRLTPAYGSGLPKRFQIYGSNLDNPGDDYRGDDWTLLGDFESVLPSGRSEPTPADNETIVNEGESFFFEVTENIPDPYVPTKFIRILFLENWAGAKIGETALIMFAEIDLYGRFQ